MSNLFDIVIPVGPSDMEVIQRQLVHTKKYILGYRNIYLIYKDLSLQIEGCTTIAESIFPFSMETVSKHHGKNDRNGWFLQQLLKLYTGFVIPGILGRYLVIDSDTFFRKPTAFVKDDRCIYTFGYQYHKLYFIHMAQMHPDFQRRIADKSGIAHHMIFERRYVKEMMDLVEAKHGEPFYDTFLKFVTDVTGAGASEYEMYFNYMVYKHADKIYVRGLRWINTNTLDVQGDFDYVSYHWHMRPASTPASQSS